MKDLFEVDELALYFGDPYIVNDKIKIYQPTIGEIISFGERQYYSMVSTLCSIPSDMKSQLDDMHLDWCEITDFQLATLLWPSFSQEQTKLLLGDLNLQNFKPVENLQNGEIVLRDAQNDIVIDELIYMRMSAFMCRMHNITKKVEKAANAFTKKILIDEDRQNIARNKDKPYKSFLLPILSAVKVRQRYSLDYVRSMHVNELMYELNRLDIIRQSDALLQGSYSGMIDTSKINKSAFDWTRPIEIEKPKGLSL